MLYGFLFLLTGEFLSFFFLSLLLFAHELGHFLTAGIFGCTLDKICFYPFGGISKFKIDLNQPIKEEFLILLMGPLFQIICYYLLSKLPFTAFHLEILRCVHWGILFFNLLPIYPLDGGRILLLCVQSFFSFYHSFQFCFCISSILLSLFLFFFFQTRELNFLFFFLLLVITLWKEIKKFPYYFDKFLLERFLEKYQFSKGKVVSSIKQFQRNRRHIVRENGKYYLEKEILRKKFTKSS